MGATFGASSMFCQQAIFGGLHVDAVFHEDGLAGIETSNHRPFRGNAPRADVHRANAAWDGR